MESSLPPKLRMRLKRLNDPLAICDGKPRMNESAHQSVGRFFVRLISAGGNRKPWSFHSAKENPAQWPGFRGVFDEKGSVCAAIRLDILQSHIPGEENPGVLADFGDKSVHLRAPLRFGIDRGEMGIRV